MVKSLPKVIYHGAKIFLKSVHKSVLQEIELSKEAARIRYRDRAAEITPGEPEQMSLNEALRILNVEQLNPEQIDRQYKYLFEANSKNQGGSFYLQSKIFRAKERLDSELSNNADLRNGLANVSNK
ncbi:hypothetical protein NQ318_018387 [Aromia moschata]|uniref:Mitochondrial import inner membrane translocase subunit TIM16 n=1 Tax=Aromia moschata TaxID=1265417 RepID=A0AAV8ZG74_9CUCU|nr:hypothetical protein NQ318_018387 [Aromia moschata]